MPISRGSDVQSPLAVQLLTPCKTAGAAATFLHLVRTGEIIPIAPPANAPLPWACSHRQLHTAACVCILNPQSVLSMRSISRLATGSSGGHSAHAARERCSLTQTIGGLASCQHCGCACSIHGSGSQACAPGPPCKGLMNPCQEMLQPPSGIMEHFSCPLAPCHSLVAHTPAPACPQPCHVA